MSGAQAIANRITQKRLAGELIDLEKNRVHYFQVAQDEVDKFLFYFIIRGDDDSHYKGGYYLGKITLPPEYPKKPGFFYMLTPNGRFTIDSKICLTNSGYHLESWNAMWSIRNMLIGFYSIFLADDTTGISHIKETPQQRKIKADNSIAFNKNNYNTLFHRFDQYFKADGSMRTDEKEIKEFINSLEEERKNAKKQKKKDKKDKKHKNKSDKKNKSSKDSTKDSINNDEDVNKTDNLPIEDELSAKKEDKKIVKVVKTETINTQSNKDFNDTEPENAQNNKNSDNTKSEITQKKMREKFIPVKFSTDSSSKDLLDLIQSQTIYTFNPKLYQTVEQLLA